MIKCNITTSKQARYFLSQKPHAQIDEVWIVLHGYGQLANSFLNWFNPIFSKNKLFISPEGLHRFYWQGFNGKVAASWMTKEDRLDDIKDYVIYLNNILEHIKPQLSANTFYHLLGFSQGAATACRWLDLGSIELHSLTLWGGTFPDDIDYFNKMNIFNKLNTKVFIGNEDVFLNETFVNNEIKRFNDHKLDVKIHHYKGGHKVDSNTLDKLNKLIQKEIKTFKTT